AYPLVHHHLLDAAEMHFGVGGRIGNEWKYRLRKASEQGNQRDLADLIARLGVGYRHVGVDVNSPLADGNGQQGQAITKHHRPAVDAGGVWGNETPANIANECRLAGLKRKLAHAGMHAVGAHYQVVLATRPVGEGDFAGAIRLLDADHRYSEAKRRVA